MTSMKGTVVINAYPTICVHTYVSPRDGWLVTTPIVEGPEQLAIFDGQLLNAYAEEVAAYVHSLRKPVKRIIVSHAILTTGQVLRSSPGSSPTPRSARFPR